MAKTVLFWFIFCLFDFDGPYLWCLGLPRQYFCMFRITWLIPSFEPKISSGDSRRRELWAIKVNHKQKNQPKSILSKIAVFSAGISFFTKQANESVLTSVDDKIYVTNKFPLTNHHIWASEPPILDITSKCVVRADFHAYQKHEIWVPSLKWL